MQRKNKDGLPLGNHYNIRNYSHTNVLSLGHIIITQELTQHMTSLVLVLTSECNMTSDRLLHEAYFKITSEVHTLESKDT